MQNQPALLSKVLAILATVLVIFLGSQVLEMNWGKLELASPSTVTVNGEATAQQNSQVAVFRGTVTVTDNEQDAAVQAVNQQMESLIADLKAFGIADADLRTENISVYEYTEPTREILLIAPPMDMPTTADQPRWQASNTIAVTLRDVSRASELASLLTATPNVQVSGPQFSVDDTSDLDAQLLEEAMQDARERAELLLSGTGQKVGKIVTISESGYAQPYPYYREMAAMDSVGSAVPVEPGSQTVYQSVTVMFEIE